MKARSLITLLFICLSFNRLFGQNLPGKPVPLGAAERFISYRNTPENHILVDTIEQYSFYNVLKETIAEAKAISNIELGGISVVGNRSVESHLERNRPS